MPAKATRYSSYDLDTFEDHMALLVFNLELAARASGLEDEDYTSRDLFEWAVQCYGRVSHELAMPDDVDVMEYYRARSGKK